MIDIPVSRALNDPDFHNLPPIERLKVLYMIDPEYRRMHPKDRWKVINILPAPIPRKDEQISEPTPPPQS